MERFEYKPSGVCSKKIYFDLDSDGKIHNLTFVGGCSGNTSGISRLVEGMDADFVADRLEGNRCGTRKTSCPDQLAHAIREALSEVCG